MSPNVNFPTYSFRFQNSEKEETAKDNFITSKYSRTLTCCDKHAFLSKSFTDPLNSLSRICPDYAKKPFNFLVALVKILPLLRFLPATLWALFKRFAKADLSQLFLRAVSFRSLANSPIAHIVTGFTGRCNFSSVGLPICTSGGGRMLGRQYMWLTTVAVASSLQRIIKSAVPEKQGNKCKLKRWSC